jgi:hypothetical protein
MITPEPALSTVSRIRKGLRRLTPEEMAARDAKEAAEKAAVESVAPKPKKGLRLKSPETLAAEAAEREKAAKPVVPKVLDELRAKMHKDKFLMKAYHTAGELDEFIADIDKVLSGKKKPLKGESKDYDRPVYDMGEFHSMKWPKNANDVSTPKATEKLIAQLPGGKYELRILGTGDYEAYGRYEDVYMALLG